jgi:hypothetical protein
VATQSSPVREVKNSDLSFTVPVDWIDRTIIAWSAPLTSSAIPPNFIVAYDKPQPGEEFGAYVNRKLADLSKTAMKFQLDLRRDIFFQERPGVELMFHWATRPGTMKQRQVYSQTLDGRIVNLSFTALEKEFTWADGVFQSILTSFRFIR